MSDQLKTLCIDSLGTNVPEDLKPFVLKYHDKLDELTKEFVKDCLSKNVEYCSAYGFIISRIVGLLSFHYCKSSNDKKYQR